MKTEKEIKDKIKSLEERSKCGTQDTFNDEYYIEALEWVLAGYENWKK